MLCREQKRVTVCRIDIDLSSTIISQHYPLLFKFGCLYTLHKPCNFLAKRFNNLVTQAYSQVSSKRLPIQKCMGKIAVQLKLHGESEIACN